MERWRTATPLASTTLAAAAGSEEVQAGVPLLFPVQQSLPPAVQLERPLKPLLMDLLPLGA